MKKLAMVFVSALLVVGGVACSDEEPTVAEDTTSDDTSGIYADGSPGATAGDDTIDAQVSIVDFAFEPNEFTATAGEPVKWQNTGEKPHTVTFDEGGIDSGNLEAGEDFSHTFEDAGEFSYHCTIHGADRMSGTITVQ